MKIGVFSVGGSREPIIFSIINNKIDIPIFFCSKESFSDVLEILKEIEKEHIINNHHIYYVDDAQNINDCYKKAREIKKYLKNDVKGEHEILVDITGGTKAMSSSLFAAMIGENYKFIYVGSKNNRYDKKIVKSGEERIFEFKDPIAELHENEKKLFEIFFNNYNFDAALEILERIKIFKKNEEDLYLGLKTLCYSYLDWDKFKISDKEYRKEIKKNLGMSLKKIETYYKYNENEKNCIDLAIVEKNIEFLDKTFNDELLIINDIYYNALRRGEQARYDDATARLYATMEQIAHFELKKKYDINSSNLKLNKLPEDLRKNYSEDEKLPFTKKYQLLYDLYLRYKNNELGKKFKEKEKEIDKILNARNNSILAHGLNPITRDQYEKFLNIVKEFFNPEFEVKFPKINFS